MMAEAAGVSMEEAARRNAHNDEIASLTKEIEELDKEIRKLPKKSSERTRLTYTIANKMQILRLILHKKKLQKYRPNAEGKWVWIPREEYEGRKYE